MTRSKSDAEKVREACHHHADRLNSNLDTVLIWLSSRTATNTPPRWRPDQARTSKTKGRVSDPTAASAMQAADTIQHVMDRLWMVAEDLESRTSGVTSGAMKRPKYGDTRGPSRLAGVADTIRSCGQALRDGCDEAWRAGATTDDLTAYSWPLGDAEGTLYHCVRQYRMRNTVRRCANGCGGAAPPKGEGATCQRCRKRKSRAAA